MQNEIQNKENVITNLENWGGASNDYTVKVDHRNLNVHAVCYGMLHVANS